MLRLFVFLAALVVIVLVFFPDELAVAMAFGKQMLEQIGIGSTGAYGAMTR